MSEQYLGDTMSKEELERIPTQFLTPSTSHDSHLDSLYGTATNHQIQGEACLSQVRSYASGYSGYVGIEAPDYQDINLRRYDTGATLAVVATSDPNFEVDWEDHDPENPRNWSTAYKALVVFAMSFSTTVTVLFSTSYTVTITKLEDLFHIDRITALMGLTIYLLGTAAGSTVLAPLSEMYGRRPVYLVSVAVFFILIVPCALANSIEAILVPRFFAAFAAASLVSNAPGSINDIVTEKYRSLAFSIWAIGPLNGPVVSPITLHYRFQLECSH
jgi:hypothetical protein